MAYIRAQAFFRFICQLGAGSVRSYLVGKSQTLNYIFWILNQQFYILLVSPNIMVCLDIILWNIILAMLVRPAFESPIKIISMICILILYQLTNNFNNNDDFFYIKALIQIFIYIASKQIQISQKLIWLIRYKMNKVLVGFLTILIPLLTLLFAGQKLNQIEDLNGQWEQYKEQNGLTLNADTQAYRRLIFLANYAKIKQHNANKDKSFEMGINHFAHFRQSQFQHMFSSNKYRNYDDSEVGLKTQRVSLQSNSVPSNDVDWEKQGKVSPVKSQGTCDAGYAFCTNSLGQSYSLFVKDPYILSEQQIVDCSKDYTTFGCQGGSRAGTIKYLQQKGVTTQNKYPWIGTKQNCKNITSEFKLTQNIVTTNGCNELKAQLAVSPLTVAVNTTNWQFYKSGILEICGSEVNHDIFLVGFSEAAWRLKNSWGVRWGEYGYIRLRMGETCGICSKPGFGFKI